MLFNQQFLKPINYANRPPVRRNEESCMSNKIAFFPTIIITALLLTLQGCVTAGIIGASTAATGVIASDQRTFHSRIDDNKISRQISKKIKNIPGVKKQAHIEIASYNQNVLLLGQTPDAEVKQKIVEAAQAQSNIKRIYNEITVSAPTSNLVRSSDSWITSKIKSKMLLTKNFRSGRIKVITENGTTYLVGRVTPTEAEQAVNIARNISGVQRVVKIFEYMGEPTAAS